MLHLVKATLEIRAWCDCETEEDAINKMRHYTVGNILEDVESDDFNYEVVEIICD